MTSRDPHNVPLNNTPRNAVSNSNVSRRSFLQAAGLCVAASGLAGAGVWNLIGTRGHAMTERQDKDPIFKISLAEWSFHRALQQGKRDHLDFAKAAKEEFGIEGVEYVNQFFKDKAQDTDYLNEMKTRAADLDVRSLLIMIDGEGSLGAPEEAERIKTVENHKRWVEAAKHLGCHSIRVNAASSGSYEEQQKLAADGLMRLSEFAKTFDLNVIVENHGGNSSNGEWLSRVIQIVDLPNCGTLPDFGNFNLGRGQQYDRYKGVTELMPFAKAVSAKSHDFNEAGDKIHTDYEKMLRIVLDAGYRGFVGIEYEGGKLSENDGVAATKKLLERVREKLTPEYA